MARLTRRIVAETADAPAAAATWTSGDLALVFDGAAGTVTIGSRFAAFIFHEGQDFSWKIEGTDDGTAYYVLDESSGSVTGHSSGGKGLTVSAECPFKYVRLLVTNDGGAAATTFAVAGAVRDA
ncbi:MAG: hypothetical protein ACF8XB_09740 [Planctomycetota bacterium JB042]